MTSSRRVAILGSTGTIGAAGLQVCAEASSAFSVVALAANRSATALAEQAVRWQPEHLAIVDEHSAVELRAMLTGTRFKGRIHVGIDGLLEMIAIANADVHLLGIAGAACLPAAFAVARTGAILALANKESIVMAGELLLDEAKRHHAKIVPVDSEHSALFQCLGEHPRKSVRRLHLTSSGGPMRKVQKDRFAAVTIEEALAHPRWKMGAKISIDSATMMNKALEIVEARHLFGIPAERIDVVVHPEAIVHSLVEFVDGSIIAQLGLPDMKVPIRYALGYPERIDADAPGLDFAEFRALHFEPPDFARFPALELGFAAARAGGTMGAVMNAANEEAVARFLTGRIRFDQIPVAVGAVMNAHTTIAYPTLEVVMAADRWARAEFARLEFTRNANPHRELSSGEVQIKTATPTRESAAPAHAAPLVARREDGVVAKSAIQSSAAKRSGSEAIE